MLPSPAAATQRPITLAALLAGRDERQSRQRLWLARYRLPLISFTVVAPGAVKDSALTRRIFNHGIEALEQLMVRSGWSVHKQALFTPDTGPEALLAANAPAKQLKCAAIGLEQSHALGRLWDIDVFSASGKLLSRHDDALPPRRCLLCAGVAAECARARRHSLPALILHMEALLHKVDGSLER